jgi:RimJ/RimL family protein N-acetyltransferase
MPVPPILGNVPSELKTMNLTLRCPHEGDGTIVFQAVLESLNDLRKWPASLPWALVEPSIEESEKFCRTAQAQFINRTSLLYLAFDQSGMLVASIGFNNINWTIPKFELGFWCRSSAQRKGVVSEAAQALLELAFHQLRAKRVEVRTDEMNHASRGVCERMGMQLEGVMRSDCITPDGELRNTCIYACVAP